MHFYYCRSITSGTATMPKRSSTTQGNRQSSESLIPFLVSTLLAVALYRLLRYYFYSIDGLFCGSFATGRNAREVRKAEVLFSVRHFFFRLPGSFSGEFAASQFVAGERHFRLEGPHFLTEVMLRRSMSLPGWRVCFWL